MLLLRVVSRCLGACANWNAPKAILRPVLRGMVKIWKVDTSEIGAQLDTFSCFQEFFSRELALDARPLGKGFVSAVDGELGMAGAIRADTLFQAKGKSYSLRRLVRDPDAAATYAEGSYATLYLAPHDYHHIHAPCDLRITSMTYIPGGLYPVNAPGLKLINRIFTRSERVLIQASTSFGTVMIILVAATNVGGVLLSFDIIQTNRLLRRTAEVRTDYAVPRIVRKGEKLGSFLLGSSVLLLADGPLLTPLCDSAGKKLRMGETICQGDS